MFLVCPSYAASNELREIVNFNREWTFHLGDVSGAEAAAFDDTTWDNANLPHSFSTPYFAADRFYVGYGWYRKHFDVPEAWSGKRVNLEFDGVFQVAEVFINGRRIGEHKGGYIGFTFDITDAVKTGDNVVAVRVNNIWDPRLAPRAGEHVFSGGIYRNVRLVVTAPIHVAWYGTFVTTPQVSKKSATVNVKTEVVNDSKTAKSVTVKIHIEDANGNTVAQMDSTQTIAASATDVFDQTSEPVANPNLWSPEHPNLYSVKTVVLDGGKPVDDYISPLGFRWFKFTADQGFFLNGEHFYFKGANVHQDHAGWDDTVVLEGDVAKSIVMARRSGNRWYLAAMNGDDAMQLQAPLKFLGKGKWTLRSFADNTASSDYQAVVESTRAVDNKTVVPLSLMPAGGFAGIISKED